MTDNIISKVAQISASGVTEQELKKINKFALTPLIGDEIFTFKVMMADNEQDDRNFEPFTAKALEDLKKHYMGKTMVFDHSARAEKQVARIYDTELVTVKTASNADLIAEIKAGIKKEVSTSCAASALVCSICGADNTKSLCRHYPGKKYDGETCHLRIESCSEAYELSFVAVPAQPRAGATKSKSLFEEKGEATEKELRARIRLAEIESEE